MKLLTCFFLIGALASITANAPEEKASSDAAELARKLSNPIANLISVPFQNNTDYGIGTNNGSNVSPVQNDFYSSITYKKTWIRPGLSAGYSAGTYGDIKRLQNLYDSITNQMKSSSAIISTSHVFNRTKNF